MEFKSHGNEGCYGITGFLAVTEKEIRQVAIRKSRTQGKKEKILRYVMLYCT